MGADDYVTKPFTPMELLARVNSQLRRYRKFMEKLEKKEIMKNIYVIGGLELNEYTNEESEEGDKEKVPHRDYKFLL